MSASFLPHISIHLYSHILVLPSLFVSIRIRPLWNNILIQLYSLYTVSFSLSLSFYSLLIHSLQTLFPLAKPFSGPMSASNNFSLWKEVVCVPNHPFVVYFPVCSWNCFHNATNELPLICHYWFAKSRRHLFQAPACPLYPVMLHIEHTVNS